MDNPLHAAKDFWNERYAAPGYRFGTEPALFLQEQASYLTQGAKALAVADGEGRNSVFLAEKGLSVTAMDASDIGVEKAKALAKERDVTIDFRLANLFDWQWEPETYDVVAAIFFQFVPPHRRPAVFAGIKQTLKPGGILLLHGYTPKQIEYGTGGPPDPENMYTEEMLREAFGDMEILRLSAYEREIEEGTGHKGMSALIDLVARKR
ncbi:class I SAM-dependent methyltransferase [Methyloligella sp. 2.7D]|uniref:SAM-dependent methyltransferase n=1 Tax=unclassified Methyloligella TaxID=2625955 RepID=UPI00157DAFBE|nr:class I SAM-dependent methyltransferase [Methyloligella sp. GL2]QKP76219.1 class I SAM-dependent methyltransferase [Methyloligella sp. GL2]